MNDLDIFYEVSEIFDDNLAVLAFVLKELKLTNDRPITIYSRLLDSDAHKISLLIGDLYNNKKELLRMRKKYYALLKYEDYDLVFKFYILHKKIKYLRSKSAKKSNT